MNPIVNHEGIPTLTGNQFMPDFIKYKSSISQCTTDTRVAFDTLSVISCLFSCIIFVSKVRHEKNRTFPDNIPTMAVGFSCGLSFMTTISGFAARQQLPNDVTGFLRAICTFQSFGFQLFAALIVWNWVVGIFLMYQLLVRGVLVSKMKQHSFYYRCVYLGIPFLSVLSLLISKKYGPVSQVGICWIEGEIQRYQYLYAHIFIGIVFFCAFTPSVIKKLRQALENERNPVRVIVYRDTMIQQLLYAAYMFLIFIVTMLYGANNFLMIVSQLDHSQYIVATTYAFCTINLVNIASIGLISSLIYGCTYKNYISFKATVVQVCQSSRLSRSAKRFTIAGRHTDSSNNSPGVVYNNWCCGASSSSSGDGGGRHRNHYPRSIPEDTEDDRRTFCSAVSINAMTAVSIPPDAKARQEHHIASNVYTTNLLLYAREVLTHNGEDDYSELDESFMTEFEQSIVESSRVTTTNGELSRTADLDLDARLALAKSRWLKERTGGGGKI